MRIDQRVIKIYSKKIQENKGKQIPVLYISLFILIFIPLLTFLFGDVGFVINYPELTKLSKSSYSFEGGLEIPPEFLALALACSL